MLTNHSQIEKLQNKGKTLRLIYAKYYVWLVISFFIYQHLFLCLPICIFYVFHKEIMFYNNNE